MAQIGLLEDNARIAKLCATMLQYAGHQVTVYDHPRECLRALLLPRATCNTKVNGSRQAEENAASTSALLPVDVLILDLHLPEIDGMQVLRLLRSNPRTHSLPLIFCTAATSHEIAQAMNIAPHASFIEKPFTFRDLTTTITNVLASAMK